MISYTVRKFWISNINPLARSILDNCVICSRHAAKTMTQLMGSLPRQHLCLTRHFLASGLDYAGPIMMRTTKGRGFKAYKGYISLCVYGNQGHPFESRIRFNFPGFLSRTQKVCGTPKPLSNVME